MTTKLSRDEFEAQLRAIGEAQYHNNHPYHHRMYQGQCSIDEIRAWALNRFCYQRIIPVKDALIMAWASPASAHRTRRKCRPRPLWFEYVEISAYRESPAFQTNI